MNAHAETFDHGTEYPAALRVPAALEGRDRLTTAFRFFLGLPHLLLVGGPVIVGSSVAWRSEDGWGWGSGSGSGGLIGFAASVGAIVSWFAIVFGGRQPEELWKLGAFYLRWRARALAYMTLLRDEYPPFGDGPYPAELILQEPENDRDRVTVAFRFFLALPHLIVVGMLSVLWAFTTALAWVVILLTGRYPETLYGFGLGVLAWNLRVEAYMLLLSDEYPPFTLRV